MYLTIKQHDAFRTLLMGFEIPFRKHIAGLITSTYENEAAFDAAMRLKLSQLTPSSPQFIKESLPKACENNRLKSAYALFQSSTTLNDVIPIDTETPMVGALNLVTFSLTEVFGDLYLLFGSYSTYCEYAEKYRYARNKLDHPGSRTLEDSHLVPVLSFVKDVCRSLDDSCFVQKSREQLLKEVSALQKRKAIIPVEHHNFRDMPYGDTRIVCRDTEIEAIKCFIYGKPEDIRKQHSCCIYGYGGVGKTALVIEVLKQIVGDLLDGTAINDYSPEYVLFFSAKNRRLELAAETGQFIEQPMRSHFETADELISLILSSLNLKSLRGFKKEGIVVLDNLETLSKEDRQKVKTFVETQSPSEMQFILTSRNCEQYEVNYKLAGFDSDIGRDFIKAYGEENGLELMLSSEDEEQLLSLAKGNTLVLVLCMRRLSNKHLTISSIKSDFNSHNAWKSISKSLSSVPSNAYEVIAEFIYKDTFEHVETLFSGNLELFYKVLKVFAIIQNESTDISTLCLITGEAYPEVEMVVDILCNYLILEKKDSQYSLNGFAEKYIVSRFLPDAETYERLSREILARQRQVNASLQKLRDDISNRPELARIISDWQIITEVDQITAAEMYNVYGEVNNACKYAGKYKVTTALEDFLRKCDEAEKLTAHPFVKYQKARILQLVDRSSILPNKHIDSIKKGFNDALYSIKTIEQYSSIQQTKSYASFLWIYGQFLSDNNELAAAMRYLEESKSSFEEQGITDQEYYKCVTLLGRVYLDYYLQDRPGRISYLRRSRGASRILSDNWDDIGSAKKHAGELKSRLRMCGDY